MNGMVAGAVLWIVGYFLTCLLILAAVFAGLYGLAQLLRWLMNNRGNLGS